MHFTKTLPVASALLLSAIPLATADGLFDRDELPRACAAICEPLDQLVRKCDVDDDRVGGDRNEDLLERQCVCRNTSFDVANFAGQCQSCIEQNWRNGCHDGSDSDSDDDDCDDAREDINDLMRACGFRTVAFTPGAAPTVTVSADRLTNIAQLTTTINPQETGAGIGRTQDGQDSNQDDNNQDDNNRNDDNQGNDDSAAGQVAIPGLLACAAGAALSGALMMQ